MKIKFRDFKFGYADADTELRREPMLFDTAFYDPRKIVDEVLNGYKFIVLGRKGSGKSAIGAKIRRMATNDSELIAERIHLSDFEFRTFAKLSSATLTGGARFASPWKLMLLLQVFSTLKSIPGLNEVDPYHEVAATLQKYGLLPSENFSRIVREVSRKGFKITLPFEVGVEIGGGEKETELSSPEEIADVLFSVLRELYLHPYRVRIIIDGLDDALRGKARQLDIVSGLIRSADSLNNLFLDMNLPVKFIVLARTDVLAMCNDPDLNKIKRDSGIVVNWREDVQNPLNSDLVGLLKLRFNTAEVEQSDDAFLWYKLFPEEISGKDSWHFVLEHTLNRPRDILQFLIECQKLYPEKDNLAPSELKAALSSYSENYFLEEMKNELAGFVSENLLIALPSLLSRLEGRTFPFSRWNKVLREAPNFENEEPRSLIELLFENGYVGQLRDRDGRRFVVFKYRDSHEKVNYEDMFLLHRGLWKALNLA